VSDGQLKRSSAKKLEPPGDVNSIQIFTAMGDNCLVSYRLHVHFILLLAIHFDGECILSRTWNERAKTMSFVTVDRVTVMPRMSTMTL